MAWVHAVGVPVWSVSTCVQGDSVSGCSGVCACVWRLCHVTECGWEREAQGENGWMLWVGEDGTCWFGLT